MELFQAMKVRTVSPFFPFACCPFFFVFFLFHVFIYFKSGTDRFVSATDFLLPFYFHIFFQEMNAVP